MYTLTKLPEWGSAGVTDLKNANLLGKLIGKDFGGLLQTFPSDRQYTGGEQIAFKLKDSVELVRG